MQFQAVIKNLFLIKYVSTIGDECSRVGNVIDTHFRNMGPNDSVINAEEGRNSQCQQQCWNNMKSAAGSTKEARDRLTQAVLPVRGKILNCLKTDLHSALKNQEINSMIDAFGLEIKDNKVIVDENKLRYGKIIITADGDVDGAHIRILFLTFIWKFAPELIEKGYIYAAVPPLYKAIQGTKITYLKDDTALEEFRKTTTRNFELNRHKGLGEMDPSEMAETVMNKDTRTLKRIVMEEAEEVARTFISLMGESVGPRRTFIEENAWRANVDV